MLKVVKIGGNVVDNHAKLHEFLADFASLEGDKILVHGGGKIATAISAALGIQTQMINGRRVTDKQTLDIIAMVYSGINKKIVAALQGFGCNALGLSGADGAFVVSKMRHPEPVDYGYVGDPVSINATLAKQLIEIGYTIIVAPITYDGKGGLLNTNADTIAQSVATGMAVAGLDVELVYCFEKQGVLSNVDDDNSVIARIDRSTFAQLKADGSIHGGMLPKLENAFTALDKGVKSVAICAAENITKKGFGGTTIIK